LTPASKPINLLGMAQPPAKRSRGLAQPVAIDPALYSNIGRHAGAVVLTVFEQVGGTDRMAEWADENPGEFFTKIFTKIISAPKQVEVTGKISIEEAVKALDAQEGIDYREVSDADTEDDE
jgi:hypothetical protein